MLVDPEFRLDSLSWGGSTLRFQDEWPMEGWLARRVRDPQTGLLFAPSGKRAVDPAFGRILTERGGEFEADPMVQVYDLRERKRQLLTVGGAMGPFHVPAWLDDNFLLVAGAFETNGDSLQPMCYGFDLRSATYRIATASPGVTWAEYRIYLDSLQIRTRRAHPDRIR
jgi:hypothetical protein